MQIQYISEFADLEPHRAAWNHLAAETPTSTIFQTFEWFASWWEAFGEAYRLQLVLGFRDYRLVAVAPFVASQVRRYGQSWTQLELAGGIPTDYRDFLYREEGDAESLIHACQTSLRWDFLQLDRIPAASPTMTLVRRAFPGWRGTQFICDPCPAYVFTPEHDGSEILSKKSIRRHENGMKRAGAVAVRHLSRSEEIEPYLEAFFAQHIARRAQTEDPSHFLDLRYQRFYRLLTQRLTRHHWLLLTVVTLDNEPVAFHFGFLYGQKLLWYKPAFSTTHAHLSPGEVLLASLFRYCREQGLRELDFTIGDEAFKSRFANVLRHNYCVEVFRSQPWQCVGYVERIVKERMKRFEVSQRVRREWAKLRTRRDVSRVGT